MGLALETERKVGQYLLSRHKITPSQWQEIQRRAARDNRSLLELLEKESDLPGVDITRALAHAQGAPFVDLEVAELSPELATLLEPAFVEKHQCLVVKKSNRGYVVAVGVLDLELADSLRFKLGQDVQLALADSKALAGTIRKQMGQEKPREGPPPASDGEKVGEVDFFQAPTKEEGTDRAAADNAPVIRLVNIIISDAIKRRASDIHVEPLDKSLRIRFRVDGLCQELAFPPPRSLFGPLLSRIKIMAGMDLAEKRKPQDGRIVTAYQGRGIDLRVNVIPTIHGESAVMRILDRERSLVGLDKLGFSGHDQERFERLVRRPNGILLITGPTGSGKTTTLYAALTTLNRPDVKIITAEDPVEYCIPGINQVQVKTQIGLDFSRILRAMLRQAPNIILVGEIRDKETATIAIQAALTGHLVFSTLHTNDAPSAITRLADMGVKPFLVSTAIMAIMAQRLVRKLCLECREAYTPTAAELAGIKLKREALQGLTVYRGKGCPACEGSGFRGRGGIYELMELTPSLRAMAFNRAATLDLKRHAREQGMTTLAEDGVRKFLAGITAIPEILRVAHFAGEAEGNEEHGGN